MSLTESALWIEIHALMGAVTLLLVILIVQQRAVGIQHGLYSELHALMEGTPQVLLTVDAHGTPRRWNDRLLRAIHCTREQLHTKRLTDLFPAEYRPQVFQALDIALTAGVCECEIPLRASDANGGLR